MPIEFTGYYEFIETMKKKAQKLESKSLKNRILGVGAEPIRKEMSNNAPRGVKNKDSWQYKADKKYAVEHLKDNIVTSFRTGSNGEPYIDIGPEEHFFYANFLEFGTVKMHSQPFAEPAFLEKRGEALRAMAEETKKVIENG